MWPGSCFLGTRRARSGLQLAPDIQNVSWELCFGNTKNTKWPTVRSGPSKCGLGVVFWEHEEHEVAYSWLRAFEMLLGNGVLGTRRARSGLQLAPGIQMRPGNGVMARWVMILEKSYTLFEVTIFSVLAWLHRNDDESREVR